MVDLQTIVHDYLKQYGIIIKPDGWSDILYIANDAEIVLSSGVGPVFIDGTKIRVWPPHVKNILFLDPSSYILDASDPLFFKKLDIWAASILKSYNNKNILENKSIKLEQVQYRWQDWEDS